MARRKRSASVDLDFAFFTELHTFYQQRRGLIRKNYKDLTKRFLDYNSPDNPQAFLRTPQFEALEIYVFLKEFLNNAKVHEIFEQWSNKTGGFVGREQLGLFEQGDTYDAVFEQMRRYVRKYPNYIFALTMGTGKTILMATCIFYEFLLANKFPKDSRYCHNALVFAPDKTVLQSLREIQTFDMAKVVPPEYRNFLSTHVRFHYLDEAGTSLNTLDGSAFNLIVSNTQKIILKRQNKEKTAQDKLFETKASTYDPNSLYGGVYAELGVLDEPSDEDSLTTNQRFEKLRRLPQLGIYIDEAHHAFGTTLAKDMGVVKTSTDTSLRNTVDQLAASLERAKTHVVACYNYTGTPYVGREVLPEVVYAYGLQDAIKNGYLKQVSISGYENAKSAEFVDVLIHDFLKHTHDLRPEGMRPKLAFFASTIDELHNELRPTVEHALSKNGLPSSRILVNVGDDKLTSNDDIREFNRLDHPDSEKQFILLVNKGREGWNCRSLFGVALFRKPKSKVFVLQATMRCLRAIGNIQYHGHVYLSDENRQILDDELLQNFRVSVDALNQTQSDRDPITIRVNPPPITVTLRRVHRTFTMTAKPEPTGVHLGLDAIETDRYRLIVSQQEGLTLSKAAQAKVTIQDLTAFRQQRQYSQLTLVAEIARYLNLPCLHIERVLHSTEEGLEAIVAKVNEFNEVLYDHVIPKLFQSLYDLTPEENSEEYDVELVKIPDEGYYTVSAAKDKVIRQDDPGFASHAHKSFHLDTYCFDSHPEKDLFWSLIREQRVKKLYFTGMLTHGQSDFHIQYIDPETHAIRSYYPDFLFQKEDESYVIVEVKAENQIDNPVVQAKKAFAEQMAVDSGMTYRIIGGRSVSSEWPQLLD